MEFTQGRRDNRYYPEDEDEERDDCIAGGGGAGCGRGGVGGLHPFLTVSSSPSPPSSSGAIVVHWADGTGASTSTNAPPAPAAVVEKEHMFEKIVTPSDVGKLNRLVIPKQHAEKYFPLDSSTHEKGLLLNFEDRNGKPWRFRYSYWNSSQSYVMTKGWSRFVKEKRLDAGDTVSFGRGVGEDARDRLFIDWKRRPDPHLDPPASLRFPRFSYNSPSPSSSSSSSFHHPYLSFSRSTAAPWAAGRLFFPQTPPPVAPSTNYFYIRSGSAAALSQPDRCPPVSPMVLDSVPVAHGKSTAPKRVRLFGVNLDQPRINADAIPENVVDGSDKLQLQLRAPVPGVRLGSAESSAASSSSSSSRGGKDM